MTTGYIRPGTYIGQLIRPGTSAPTPFRRILSLVGRGNRLARVQNKQVLRSFVYDEVLSFTPVPPYRATTSYASDRSKEGLVLLVDDLGQAVPTNKWNWINSTTVELSADVFDSNRVYTLDYQSTDRSVLDPIPVNDLRGSPLVSTKLDQDEFEEGRHFRLPVAFSDAGVLKATALTNEDAALSAIAETLGNGSSADMLAHADDSDFTHPFSRSYSIVCTEVDGVAPDRTVTFRWSSSPISGGWASLPHRPYHPGTTAQWEVFDVVEDAENIVTVTLEHGIKIDFDLANNTIQANDAWAFSAYAPAYLEVDPRHRFASQHESVTITADADNSGTGSIELDFLNTDYNSERSLKFALKCITVAGASPNRTAIFVWSRYGDETAISSGTFSINEANASGGYVSISSANGVGLGIALRLSFGADHFDTGDEWVFVAHPARKDVLIKDDREYLIKVTSVANVSNVLTIGGTWATDTVEGGFGAFTFVSGGYLNTTNSTTGLPDGLRVIPRNVHALATTRYAANDTFTLKVTLSDVFDWSLSDRRTETFSTSSLIYDPIGRTTGTPGSWYLLLDNTPVNVLSVSAGGSALAYARVGTTRYLYFTTKPVSTVTVVYEWNGAEPAPGSYYYLTSNHVRTADLYNQPIFLRTREEAVVALGPMSTTNDLMIGALVAFDYNIPGLYVTQVSDEDGDGAFTDADYVRAIRATEVRTDVRDRIVLNRHSVVGAALTSLDLMNDPLQKKRSLGWFGLPEGTVVGDETVIGSIVHTARVLFKVYGDSPAHGTRILHEATWVRRQVTMPDGRVQTLKLDGSFMSVALAALNASFTEASTTLLKRQITSFSEVHVHSEAEQMALGAAQVIYFTNEGGGVYRIEEDVTTDDYDIEFKIISAMCQKQYVSEYVTTEVDRTIAVVPPSQSEAADSVKARVIGALKALLAAGKISEYQTNGVPRALSEDTDVLSFVNPNDPTQVNFRYMYFLRYPIKTAFGLYTVDGKSLT